MHDMTTARIRAWCEDGTYIPVPVFGPQSYGSDNPSPVTYAPRVASDPYPWERWGFRYKSSELALVEVTGVD